jgi:cob(I)alamin adenosyltransferase
VSRIEPRGFAAARIRDWHPGAAACHDDRVVHLSRIYTRTGDDGSTGLGDGTRRPKHDLRIAAYGTVDETSSAIGVALALGMASGLSGRIEQILRHVQNDLFDAGADLCVPGTGSDRLRIRPLYVTRLEGWIDEWNARLTPLSSFVLPGGEPGAAWLHLARTVSRRAERLVSELLVAEPATTNPEVLRYLNRLSDLLFVLARVANDDGKLDVLWTPGEAQSEAGK